MRYFTSILFLYLSIIYNSFGQSIQKYKEKADGGTVVYHVMEPQTKISGIVLLLPASGEKPQSVFNKTTLPHLLAQKGFLIIVPEINNLIFADQHTINQLEQICKTQSARYSVSGFVVGGLSSGGAIAVRYAEHLAASESPASIKGVFAIDAPLDLSRVHASAERRITYNCLGIIVKEGSTIKNSLENFLGGSPESKPGQYTKYSAYSPALENGGNAIHLKTVPIRLYSEPDLRFVRKTYCADLQEQDINAIDSERLNAFLIKLGNKNSEYIATTGRGFHSWNIVDPVDCVNWILKITK